MLKRKRIFFWSGILLLFLAVIGWGYFLYNKPHRSAADATVAFAIGADSLFAEYQRDEKTADQKYLGKVIEVSGKLSEIQHDGQTEIWILSSQSNTAGAGGINCQLFSPEKVASPRPKPGDQVTIKGKCTGFLMDVDLADCVQQ